MTDLAANGSCQNPAQEGTTRLSANSLVMQDTISSPMYLSSRGATSSSWTKAIPSGNFGGLMAISFNDKPTKVSSLRLASSSSTSMVGSSDFSFA